MLFFDLIKILHEAISYQNLKNSRFNILSIVYINI